MRRKTRLEKHKTYPAMVNNIGPLMFLGNDNTMGIIIINYAFGIYIKDHCLTIRCDVNGGLTMQLLFFYYHYFVQRYQEENTDTTDFYVVKLVRV